MAESTSRRDFLTLGFGKAFKNTNTPTDSMVNPTIAKQETRKKTPTMSRRQFFKFILAAGGTAVADHYLASPVKAQESYIKYVEQPQKPPNTPEEKPLTVVESAVISSLTVMGEIICNPVLKYLGIPTGTSMTQEFVEKEILNKPWQEILPKITLLNPAIEEALFRWLPSELLAGQNKNEVWGIGIPTSAIFALVHNIDEDKVTKEKFLNLSKIPLWQFTSGLVYWHLMRKGGYFQALAGHGASNGIVYCLGKMITSENKTSSPPPRNPRNYR